MDSALESLKCSFQNFVNSQNVSDTQHNAIVSTNFVQSLEQTLRRVRREIRGIQDYLLTQKTRQDKVTKAVIESIETLKQVQLNKPMSTVMPYPLTGNEKVLAQMKQCIETQKNISQNIVNLLRQQDTKFEMGRLRVTVESLSVRVAAIEATLTTKEKKKTTFKDDVKKTRAKVADLEEKWRSEGLSLPKPPPNPPPEV